MYVLVNVYWKELLGMIFRMVSSQFFYNFILFLQGIEILSQKLDICNEKKIGEEDDKYRGIFVVFSLVFGDRWFFLCDNGSQIVDQVRC